MEAGMIGISVEVESASVQSMLSQLLSAGERLPVKKMQVIGYRSVLRNFADGGRPVKWKRLSALTVLNRKRGGDVPLQDSGALKKSVHAEMLGTTGFKVVSRHPAAAWMQEGTKGPYTITGNPFLFFKVPGGKISRAKNARGFKIEVRQNGQWVGRTDRGRLIRRQSVTHPGIQARPFMVWQHEDIEAIEAILLQHLMSAAGYGTAGGPAVAS